MSRQLHISSHIKIFGADNKSAYVAQLYREGGHVTGLGVLNTDNMFVYIKQFSMPIKAAVLKEERTIKYMMAELLPLKKAFQDQRTPEVVYYMGNSDARAQIMETLGLPLSIMEMLTKQSNNGGRHMFVLPIAPYSAKFYRDGLEELFVSTGLIFNKGAVARAIFAPGMRMIAYNTCYVAMLNLSTNIQVLCALYLAEQLTTENDTPHRAIIHILNALGGLAPPTSKPRISAFTRDKLNSIAAIKRFEYINTDLPEGTSKSPFELFGDLDDGESDEEHEVVLPSRIGGTDTPKARLFLQSLKRKLGDVTSTAAVPEKKVTAEVAGSCQEEDTAAAHPTPREPEPPLATVSPIPAVAPTTVAVAEVCDGLDDILDAILKEEEVLSTTPPAIAVADVDNILAEIERVDDFFGADFFENLGNLGNVGNLGDVENVENIEMLKVIDLVTLD